MSDRANLIRLSKLLIPRVKLQLVKQKKMRGRGLKLPGEAPTTPTKPISRAVLQREVLRVLKSAEFKKLLTPPGVQQGSGIIGDIIKSVAPLIVGELIKLGKSIFKKKKSKKNKKK